MGRKLFYSSHVCEMYEDKDSVDQPIDRVVILIVTEDGAVQTFSKDKNDYLPLLKSAIKELMKNLKNKILDNLPTIFIALVFIFGMTPTFNHVSNT